MDYFNSQSIIYLRICRRLCKSVEKAPIMYSIKSAILDSLHGKDPPNNESDDYKNLEHF